VSASPSTDTAAVSSAVARKPRKVSGTGNRKTPRTAPSLPIPAEIPRPVARIVTGCSSLGMTKVSMPLAVRQLPGLTVLGQREQA
jgi:hypothetical protein